MWTLALFATFSFKLLSDVNHDLSDPLTTTSAWIENLSDDAALTALKAKT